MIFTASRDDITTDGLQSALDRIEQKFSRGKGQEC